MLPILWAGVCLAQSTPPANQPVPTVTAFTGTAFTQVGGGFRTTVDSKWIKGSGYRPIRIGIVPLAAVTADRELEIRIMVHSFWRSNEEGLRVEQSLTIPGGTPPGQAIETTVSVPPTPSWCDCSLEIEDPAVPITIFSQRQVLSPGSTLSSGWDDMFSTFPRILFLGDGIPETAPLSASLPQPQGYRASPVPINPDNFPLPTAMAHRLADLPERWIDYSSLDVICLTIEQLADLARKRPAAYRAVLQWADAGGNLWICGLAGAEGPWQRMADLEKLLELQWPVENTHKGTVPFSLRENRDSPLIPAGWTQPSTDSFGRNDLNHFNDPLAGQPGIIVGPQGVLRPMPGKAEKNAQPIPAPPKESPFLLREYGFGTVAAIAAEDPFSGGGAWSKWEWDWLLTTLGNGRWQWNTRHGLEVGQPHPDFWNFLIPGVGLAPVLTFQILISLFVLGIGPANYWLLRRGKRLHLMVLTIPLSAAVVTGALIGYALLADGLRTRVRVRSVTRLDQRRGTAVTWARLSYYAGMAPAAGLTFPSDVAVYPLLNKYEYLPQETTRKKMYWEDDQRLVQGWLDSRTPTQYLTVRSRPSTCRLEITPIPDSSGVLQIENRLGVPIDRVAIRGRDGKYYEAAQVAPGAKARAKPTTLQEIRFWLSAADTENQPLFPPGMDQRSWNRVMRSSRHYYYYYRNMPNAVNLGGSRLEQVIGSLPASLVSSPEVLSSAGGNSPPASGCYIALVSRSPEVELGAPTAREETSYHVIMGEW
jgi:hypothetical protein